MELKINSKKEQSLLSRTEVKGEISFEKETPSRLGLRKKLADALKAAENTLIIAKIDTDFGSRRAVFTAHVYSSEAELKKNASPVMAKRVLPKGKKGEEAKPAEKEEKAEE